MVIALYYRFYATHPSDESSSVLHLTSYGHIGRRDDSDECFTFIWRVPRR